MALDVARVNIWVAGIEDRPGSLAEKLALLSEAGAQLEFVMVRPTSRGAGSSSSCRSRAPGR